MIRTDLRKNIKQWVSIPMLQHMTSQRGCLISLAEATEGIVHTLKNAHCSSYLSVAAVSSRIKNKPGGGKDSFGLQFTV